MRAAVLCAVAIAISMALSPVALAGEPAKEASEVRSWLAIKDSTDPADFRSFLRRFPDGTFAAAARLKLKHAKRPKAGPDPSRWQQVPAGGTLTATQGLAPASLARGAAPYGQTMGLTGLSAAPSGAVTGGAEPALSPAEARDKQAAARLRRQMQERQAARGGDRRPKSLQEILGK